MATPPVGTIDVNNPLVQAQLAKGINPDVAIGNVMENLRRGSTADPTFAGTPASNTAPPAKKDFVGNLLSGLGADFNMNSLFDPVSVDPQDRENILEASSQRFLRGEAGIAAAKNAAIAAENERADAAKGAKRVELGLQQEDGFGGVDTSSIGLLDAITKDSEKRIKDIQAEFNAKSALLSGQERVVVQQELTSEKRRLEELRDMKFQKYKAILGFAKDIKELNAEAPKDTSWTVNQETGDRELVDNQTGQVISTLPGGVAEEEVENYTQQIVLNMADKWNDAGIEPTDTIEEATRKVKTNSELWKQATRLANGGTGDGVTPIEDGSEYASLLDFDDKTGEYVVNSDRLESLVGSAGTKDPLFKLRVANAASTYADSLNSQAKQQAEAGETKADTSPRFRDAYGNTTTVEQLIASRKAQGVSESDIVGELERYGISQQVITNSSVGGFWDKAGSFFTNLFGG